MITVINGLQLETESKLTQSLASNARRYEKITIFDQYLVYLGNDARYSHSYYGRRIGNRTQGFEWY